MTTGAGNDIERATEMARKMVCEWGMSELGPLSFRQDRTSRYFLDAKSRNIAITAKQTAIRIDEQVRKLVEEAYDSPRNYRRPHEAMVRVAEALLEREVLDGSEVLDLINGKQLSKLQPPKPPSGGTTQPVIAPQANPSPVPGLLGGESPQPA